MNECFNNTPARQSHQIYRMFQVSIRKVTVRKEMFYLTMHSTHFILRLYSVGHMVKDHSDSERKPAASTWATPSD